MMACLKEIELLGYEFKIVSNDIKLRHKGDKVPPDSVVIPIIDRIKENKALILEEYQKQTLALKQRYNALIERYNKAQDVFESLPEDCPKDRMDKLYTAYGQLVSEISKVYAEIGEPLEGDVFKGYDIEEEIQ